MDGSLSSSLPPSNRFFFISSCAASTDFAVSFFAFFRLLRSYA